MFQEILTPSIDFDAHLNACVQALNLESAHGAIVGFERQDGSLRMRYLNASDVEAQGVDRFEVILFDGGPRWGAAWKHLFFPQQRAHYFVCDG